jgi:type IV secretory pathway component VirB8
MNTAQKIESFAYPAFRRHSDRMATVTRAIQRVESAHASRQRRLALLLIGAAALLIINGIVIVTLG